MDVVVTCKNEGAEIKIEGARVLTTFLQLLVYNSKVFNILLPHILDSFFEGSRLVRVSGKHHVDAFLVWRMKNKNQHHV